MSLKAGLVGLPNVGKSTLFNALTKSQIPAENYPFCTIEPHTAITVVPDERLEKLKKIYVSKEVIPATVSFVDIAGLVKGASQGEGLGNQFLSNIREVDLIIHVLRCFEDPNVHHVSEKLDPLDDFETIQQELLLKDLEMIQKRQEKLENSIKGAQSNPIERKKYIAEKELLEKIQQAINAEKIKEIPTLIKQSNIPTIPLLAAKNFLIIANIDEKSLADHHGENNPYYQQLVKRFGKDKVIPLCVKLEQELAQLPDEETEEMMHELGLKQKGLDEIIQRTFKDLGLINFFTCGPKETHAWPINKKMNIRQASGEIHSDLEKGFICAEVVNYADIIQLGSPAKAKELGKVRTEGQNYIVQDGDIILVRFNV